MGNTFLDMANKLLRRINEVEMTETNFVGARGVQALAKDAIVDTISKINATKFEWPFNAYEHTITLIPGINEYAWPVRFKVADWNSFQIQKDAELNIQAKTLRRINRDQWYSYQRDFDRDTDPLGRRQPMYIFESHGTGFGVTPSPNREFILKYRYYVHPEVLVNPNDQTTIPAEYEYVIMNGALWYMALFKENEEHADRLQQRFKEDLTDMTNILIQKPDDMYAGVINTGTKSNRSSFLYE